MEGAPCVAGVAAGRNGRSSLWHSVSLAHARSSHPLACVDIAQVQLGDMPETWEFLGTEMHAYLASLAGLFFCTKFAL